ncbi:MAG TPA: hypothetical protein VFC78_01345 [Tepidisphaeraceae bacterium]|nr:hypothetical protein [Tepidisphaeraceae bacterium]
MSQFIHFLESRTLLSASITSATLIADSQQVSANAATTRTDVKLVASTFAADTKKIAADLKSATNAGNRKANAALLNTLKADEGKALAKLRADSNVLLGKSSALSQRSLTDAKALLLHPTNVKLGAKVAADVSALNAVTTAPLANVQADTQSVTLSADLTNIAAANPYSTSLATDVPQSQSDVAGSIGNVGVAAENFSGQVGTLAGDAGATPTSATPPNLVGSFSGPAVAKTGSHVGQIGTLVLDVTSEGTDGSLSGTATTTDSSSGTSAFALAGSVTSGGAFTATLSDSTGAQLTLNGAVHGKVISGNFADDAPGSTNGGTFTITGA